MFSPRDAYYLPNAQICMVINERRHGSPLDDYYDEQFNVGMAFKVYCTAYESGVKRVVLASSNHAADWYEHALIHRRDLEMLDPYRLPLSDNFYGWAIDEELSTLNIEYEQKRLSGRLHAPHVHVMSRGWSAKRLGAKSGRAARDTQFKDTLLGLPDEDDLPMDIIKDLST